MCELEQVTPLHLFPQVQSGDNLGLLFRAKMWKVQDLSLTHSVTRLSAPVSVSVMWGFLIPFSPTRLLTLYRAPPPSMLFSGSLRVTSIRLKEMPEIEEPLHKLFSENKNEYGSTFSPTQALSFSGSV